MRLWVSVCHLISCGFCVCCGVLRDVKVFVFKDFLRDNNAGETVSLEHNRDNVCESFCVVFGSDETYV